MAKLCLKHDIGYVNVILSLGTFISVKQTIAMALNYLHDTLLFLLGEFSLESTINNAVLPFTSLLYLANAHNKSHSLHLVTSGRDILYWLLIQSQVYDSSEMPSVTV